MGDQWSLCACWEVREWTSIHATMTTRAIRTSAIKSSREVRIADRQARTIAMTTGAHATSDHATGMATMRGRSGAVQETTGKARMTTGAIVTMMHVGQSGIATGGTGIGTRTNRSRGTC